MIDSTNNQPNDARMSIIKCEMYNTIDNLIEKAQIEELSLEDTLKIVLPELISKLDCEAIFIRTYDEDLKMKNFNALKKGYNSIPMEIKEIDDFLKTNKSYITKEIGTLIALKIDVAGEYFGIIGSFFDKNLDEQIISEKKEAMNTAIEVLDNYLSMIYNSSKKQKTIDAIGEAISDKVLSRGLDKAIIQLYESIKFDKLIFLYWNEEEDKKYNRPMNYIIYDKNEHFDDSENVKDKDLYNFIQSENKFLIEGQENLPRYFIEKLQLRKFVEMSLIYGKSIKHLVGKILISRENKGFNTTQRDILHNFSTLIRQRVVDYNKEYRALLEYFSPKTANRLLSEDNYEKYIMPKEQHVAVLYSDITSFTKISESLLKEPKAIGDFINEWSYKVVEIIWENGGVFDKMVGDCAIGLFGPPFYEYDAKNMCIRAIKTAIEISKWTDELSKNPKYKILRESDQIPGLGVATGINYCPMFVGIFGPNRNFTGFSSGMNNTARLQSQAGFRDIFVMESVKEIIGKGVSGFSFGEMRQAKVKNVKEPLTFYPLKYSFITPS